MKTNPELYKAWLDADNAWSKELTKVFGRAACNARYEKRGRSTPELERLWRAFHSTGDTFKLAVGWSCTDGAEPKDFKAEAERSQTQNLIKFAQEEQRKGPATIEAWLEEHDNW